jgi:hypothetical protein
VGCTRRGLPHCRLREDGPENTGGEDGEERGQENTGGRGETDAGSRWGVLAGGWRRCHYKKEADLIPAGGSGCGGVYCRGGDGEGYRGGQRVRGARGGDGMGCERGGKGCEWYGKDCE